MVVPIAGAKLWPSTFPESIFGAECPELAERFVDGTTTLANQRSRKSANKHVLGLLPSTVP
jgi:hypothetical protein